MTTKEIEYAVARHFDFRKNNIIPNVSWGFKMHECDLLVIDKYGSTTEVEIKVSKSDLKADAKKDHQHDDQRIAYLYFALPQSLYAECKDLIPERAGILIVSESIAVSVARKAEFNLDSRELSADEITAVLRLGNMRTWSMRRRELERVGVVRTVKPKAARERINSQEPRHRHERLLTYLRRGDQADIAERLKCTPATVSAVLNGKQAQNTELAKDIISTAEEYVARRAKRYVR